MIVLSNSKSITNEFCHTSLRTATNYLLFKVQEKQLILYYVQLEKKRKKKNN